MQTGRESSPSRTTRPTCGPSPSAPMGRTSPAPAARASLGSRWHPCRNPLHRERSRPPRISPPHRLRSPASSRCGMLSAARKCCPSRRTPGAVFALAYSPDGKQLATGSNDMTVKVFDAKTGKEAKQFIGHSGPVHASLSALTACASPVPAPTRQSRRGNSNQSRVPGRSGASHVQGTQGPGPWRRFQ